jgi:hypothetical protein
VLLFSIVAKQEKIYVRIVDERKEVEKILFMFALNGKRFTEMQDLKKKIQVLLS